MTRPWLCPFGRLQQAENNVEGSLEVVVCYACLGVYILMWRKLKLQRQTMRTANGCVLYPKHLVFVSSLC